MYNTYNLIELHAVNLKWIIYTFKYTNKHDFN